MTKQSRLECYFFSYNNNIKVCSYDLCKIVKKMEKVKQRMPPKIVLRLNSQLETAAGVKILEVLLIALLC